jgi:phosphohistidine phosphatase
MPDLLLFRHGKSDWDAPFGYDRERPLAERGIRAARTMGRLLTLAHQVPDLVLTSPAVRARTTAELAAEAGEWAAPIVAVDAFYGAGPGAVIDVLRDAGGDAERVMAVGHEPTWSHTASLLIGGGSIRVVTGAVAAVEVTTWAGLSPGGGRLRWMLVPRLFADTGLEL